MIGISACLLGKVTTYKATHNLVEEVLRYLTRYQELEEIIAILGIEELSEEDKELFNKFPRNISWEFVEFEENDLNNIYYIDYDYWNLLSRGTSRSIDASITIKEGTEILEVSNKPFIDGVEYLKKNSFPPIILITCNDKKYLIIEGHSRVTIYGMIPEKFKGTYGFIGHCSEEEMSKYDKRMV